MVNAYMKVKGLLSGVSLLLVPHRFQGLNLVRLSNFAAGTFTHYLSHQASSIFFLKKKLSLSLNIESNHLILNYKMK